KNNWPKMEQVIEKVNQARQQGLKISADMYTYTAGATGLDASMPPWVQEGGYDEWAKRLQNIEIRNRVIKEMKTPTDAWENLLIAAGAKGILLPYFRNPELKKFQGMTLAAVAQKLGKSPEEAAIELVIKDGTRVSAIYFLMSEDNIEMKIKQPWVSFGSDAGAPDPAVAKQFGATHPRTYGNFSRVIARYVRDKKILTLESAIRKLTSLPASHLKIKKRGLLREGYFADVLVFDPNQIQDHVTFDNPHQLSTGMDKVLINGELVVDKGKHTGALPGMIVHGPGWMGGRRKK
ncbi:MAG TPA: D-aminoacylase, partial [Aeromonadales bacterium]|nr:D-aminoacylase [Aeromonadales bacterium]